MGYSIYDFFSDLIEKYNAGTKDDPERCEYTAFISALNQMPEYRKRDFLYCLIKAEADSTGDTVDRVISDMFDEENIVIIRHNGKGSFSVSDSLPEDMTLTVKGKTQ